MVTNSQRAAWAEQVLTTFRSLTHCEEHCGEDIHDLMCNLMHAARARGLDPVALTCDATSMFNIEESEDD